MATAQHPLHLLINPAAGGGRGRRVGEQAVAAFRTRNRPVTPWIARDSNDFVKKAAEAARACVPVLAVAGGDGSCQLAAQELQGTDTALGLI